MWYTYFIVIDLIYFNLFILLKQLTYRLQTFFKTVNLHYSHILYSSITDSHCSPKHPIVFVCHNDVVPPNRTNDVALQHWSPLFNLNKRILHVIL